MKLTSEDEFLDAVLREYLLLFVVFGKTAVTLWLWTLFPLYVFSAKIWRLSDSESKNKVKPILLSNLKGLIFYEQSVHSRTSCSIYSRKIDCVCHTLSAPPNFPSSGLFDNLCRYFWCMPFSKGIFWGVSLKVRVAPWPPGLVPDRDWKLCGHPSDNAVTFKYDSV